MKSAINDPQGRVNAQRSQTSKPDWGQFPYRGRGGSYQPKGCQNCKERGRAEECDHCFACGSSGHVARECPRNRNRSSPQGNGWRLFRRDTTAATSPINVMAVARFIWREQSFCNVQNVRP